MVDELAGPIERVAWLSAQLATGRTFSTMEVARALQMTRQGAYRTLTIASRVAPICQIGGRWQYIRQCGVDPGDVD